ncbi:TPA: hypothetical protein ACPZND_001893 [Yersinia enterocolitica]
MNNLEELKKVALAATPGPWEKCDSYGPNENGTCISAVERPDLMIASTTGYYGRVGGIANTHFIALANPAVILDLIAQLEAAQLDATRWRALLSSPAIRILGHAGLQDDKPIDGHYCHFGMEIWSHHEPYYDNKKAGELITRYADNMIAAGFTVKEDATPIVIVPAPAGVIMRPQYENPLERYAAGRDGECHHKDCPQLRDNEPMATGRHCPIDNWDDE